MKKIIAIILLVMVSAGGCDFRDGGCSHKLEIYDFNDGVTRLRCPKCGKVLRGIVVSTAHKKCDSKIIGEERAKALCEGIPSTYLVSDEGMISLIHYHGIYVNKSGVLFLDYVDEKEYKKLKKQGYMAL